MPRSIHVNTELLVGADCLQASKDTSSSIKRDISCSEVARIKEIKGNKINLYQPLKFDHPKQ